MNIMLFGISNVGKTVAGEILANKIGFNFYDLDEEVKRKFNTTLEAFVNRGVRFDRDKSRGMILKELVERDEDKVISVSPIVYSRFFNRLVERDDVLAIELQDTVNNIFDRLVFSDENDVIYKVDEYKNEHASHYLKDIKDDISYFRGVFKKIENKYFMNGKTPEEVVDDLINLYIKNKGKYVKYFAKLDNKTVSQFILESTIGSIEDREDYELAKLYLKSKNNDEYYKDIRELAKECGFDYDEL